MTVEEIIELVKEKTQKGAPLFIQEARKKATKQKALVTGDGFIDELIGKIEKIESLDRAEARKKYSKDIRGVFSRITSRRSLVFNSEGSSEINNFKTDKSKEDFLNGINKIKGGKSLLSFLEESLFHLMDIDPNGLIFMEYKGDEKCYPTYKSIHDIRDYESDGQSLKWVLFESKKELEYKFWRFVDSEKDVEIIEKNGVFVVNNQFAHPFGMVPGFIVSPFKEIGTEIRYSSINEIIPDAEEYARDKSILTLYKFLHGFPITWRYTQSCVVCNGTGKQNNTAPCLKCDGTGTIGKNDVTDIIEIDLPRSTDDPTVAPNLAGFIQPDLDTWKQYKEDLRDAEERMESTIWGMDMMRDKNETATGKFIDQQPVINTLNTLTTAAEFSYNFLANLFANWQLKTKPKTEVFYLRIFGRRFIIESIDTLQKKYSEGQKTGLNSVLMDDLLEQIIVSKFSSNRDLMDLEMKKAKLEPYIHLGYKETFDIFGAVEAEKKTMFVSFWEQADKNKELTVLRQDMETYFSDNAKQKTINV